MNGLDINVIEFLNDSHSLYDMWASTTDTPSNDTVIGGKFDLFNSTYVVSNGNATIYFERRLDTGDKYDKVLVQV
jgi:hypothetical protein